MDNPCIWAKERIELIAPGEAWVFSVMKMPLLGQNVLEVRLYAPHYPL